MLTSSFQSLGNVKSGNLFIEARLWAGTYRLSAFLSISSGLRALLVNQVSLKVKGRRLCLNLCMNFRAEYLINSFNGKMPYAAFTIQTTLTERRQKYKKGQLNTYYEIKL